MRTSRRRRRVYRQFKYPEKETQKFLRFSSFSSSLRSFNLPTFSIIPFASVASSFSSLRIMMKFLGNWVKYAYTQKHCFLFFLQRLFFLSDAFFPQLFIP